MKTFTLDKPSTQRVVITESGEYLIEMTHPGARAEVVGTFLVEGSQVIDLSVILVHKAPHTSAHTVLKGVASGHSQIRFLGRIIIDPNCGDTNSFLEERILLLSDTARAQAIPELEILSDDVKCSHAAAISTIPQEQLFYLSSRGLSEKVAKDLIVQGFLEIL